jgi:hypothetical protein
MFGNLGGSSTTAPATGFGMRIFCRLRNEDLIIGSQEHLMPIQMLPRALLVRSLPPGLARLEVAGALLGHLRTIQPQPPASLDKLLLQLRQARLVEVPTYLVETRPLDLEQRQVSSRT